MTLKITTFGARNLTDRPGMYLYEAAKLAVDSEATTNSMHGGVIERLEAKIEAQTNMLARMLMVQFGQYEDHFIPGYEPTTDAEKLGFILSSEIVVREL